MGRSSRQETVRDLLKQPEESAPGRQDVDRLFEVIYDELHELATAMVSRERTGHTLRPTDLVHEVYLRLIGSTPLPTHDRTHFLGIAGRAMRQVLVAYARRHAAAKRGGKWRRVDMDLHEGGLTASPFVDVLLLNEALEKLGVLDERMARIAELHLFAGLRMKDVAEIVGVSKRTADGDWGVARKWLSRELG